MKITISASSLLERSGSLKFLAGWLMFMHLSFLFFPRQLFLAFSIPHHRLVAYYSGEEGKTLAEKGYPISLIFDSNPHTVLFVLWRVEMERGICVFSARDMMDGWVHIGFMSFMTGAIFDAW